MDETKDDKKLLRSSLDTPEILSAQLEQPLLTTEEFIKTTPPHELKNVFGMGPGEISQPKVSPPSSPEQVSKIKAIQFSELPKIFEPAATVSPQKEKSKHSVGTFFLGLFLIVVILLIGLYIWGGILKERGVSTATETLSQ